MWPRVIEVTIGCWLAISPFVFGHEPDEVFLWTTDLGSGFAVVLISLLCFWPPLSKAHLLHLGIGAFLVATGFLAPTSPPPPALENHVIVGLLLILFGILPSNASEPPRGWREFEESRRE